VTIQADLERDGPSWSFVVQSGDDALRRLHLWLNDLKAVGAIGDWYDVGSRTDPSGTFALVEFENDDDGVRACSAWIRAEQPV
jgi:hypothetical protein